MIDTPRTNPADPSELVASLREFAGPLEDTFGPTSRIHKTLRQAADTLAAQQREIEGLRAAVSIGLDSRALSAASAAQPEATKERLERAAEAFYLAMYEAQGGQWSAVETKYVWREKAARVLAAADRER